MAKSTSTLEWCIVTLSEDLNWWVEEVSDPVHWDTDGLSIIDPRQLDHLVEAVDPLRDYGFESDIMERAMIPFRIDKDLGGNRVRLIRVKESIFEADEKLFALPDTLDDETSPYADFLDHITRLRVKLLNDLFDFEQRLSVDEVEDEIREENNADYMEGRAVHLYNEITSVLEYVPAGWDVDEDDEVRSARKEPEETEDFPDVEEDEKSLAGDKTLRWDEDDEEDEESEDSDSDEDDDEEEDKDEKETPKARKR